MSERIIVCGSSNPEPRGECPNGLHDWPLPSGYVAADETAQRRLRNGWKNTRCPDCGLYGWSEGRKRSERDVRVPAEVRSTDTTAHDLDRMGICRRCGQGITAKELLDGEERCDTTGAET